MDVSKIDDDLVLLKGSDWRFSFYEYTNGKLKKSNVFFKREDEFSMWGNCVYITSFKERVYVYWKECLSLHVKKFMRLISKNEFKAYFEDETGDIWILSGVPLAPDGDISDVVLRFNKK